MRKATKSYTGATLGYEQKLWQAVKRDKFHKCERCRREIRSIGRCLPCNYFYKHKRYFPGLRENHDYDKAHGMEDEFVKQIANEKKFINQTKKEYVYERICKLCDRPFKTNKEYTSCYRCFRFFMQFGGIKNYQQFLEGFQLSDSENSKSNYIEFVDKRSIFLKMRGEWTIGNILANPGEFLDRVKEDKKS